MRPPLRYLGGVGLRPIPSTRGRYWAGDDGHVYRAAGLDARGVWREWRPVAETSGRSMRRRAAHGMYRAVNLCVDGMRKTFHVHRAVAEAWLEDYHPLLVVHHVNFDELDNRPANLACMTRMEHERAHGNEVREVDVANDRTIFEMDRDKPWPDPFAGARTEKESAEARRRDRTGSKARWFALLAQRADNTLEALGRAERKADRIAGKEVK